MPFPETKKSEDTLITSATDSSVTEETGTEHPDFANNTYPEMADLREGDDVLLISRPIFIGDSPPEAQLTATAVYFTKVGQLHYDGRVRLDKILSNPWPEAMSRFPSAATSGFIDPSVCLRMEKHKPENLVAALPISLETELFEVMVVLDDTHVIKGKPRKVSADSHAWPIVVTALDGTEGLIFPVPAVVWTVPAPTPQLT